MTKDTFKEIMIFAVKQERDSGKYYKKFQELVDSYDAKKIFKELEEMEYSHANSLENFTLERFERWIPIKIRDLQLPNVSKPLKLEKDLSYEDALLIAIEREVKFFEFYNKLAQAYDNIESKNLMLLLASEEARHKKALEDLLNKHYSKAKLRV